MLKAEEFENCKLLAIKNNVKALAHFSVGMGGRSQELVQVASVLVVPLDEFGMVSAACTEAIEKMKKATSLVELQEICKAANILWIGGM
jgi:hypothetical protein